MRKLTALEREGKDLLLRETKAYFDNASQYDLQPSYYPEILISRKYGIVGKGIDGLFALQEWSNGQRLSLSLCFGRPARDWTMSLRLDNINSIDQAKQITISKEYKGMGNGQYLIAERVNGRWAITASEYD